MIKKRNKAMETGTSSSCSYYAQAAEIVAARGIIIDTDRTRNAPEITFESAWKAFTTSVQSISSSKSIPMSADDAWNDHFQGVMQGKFKDEKEFSLGLLHALGNALDGFCNAERDEAATATATAICLKGTNIGFATGVCKDQNLGFSPSYSVSSGIANHACVMFRSKTRADDTAAAAASKETACRSAKRIKTGDHEVPVTKDEHKDGELVDDDDDDDDDDSESVEVDDEAAEEQTIAPSVTRDDWVAVVVLKHSENSSKEYTNGSLLHLRRDHDPMAQALLHAMDVWRCLARRGLAVESLPVMVLAGRTDHGKGRKPRRGKSRHGNGKESMTEPRTLCCMQGQLFIPCKIGFAFTFALERCIKFTAETNKRALAIYLVALREGLDNARKIADMGRHPVPRSLCCQKLPDDWRLMSSPIPDATPLELKIGQGELYSINLPQNVSVGQWVSGFAGQTGMRSYCLVGGDVELETVLIKVSHKTVHNTFVPLEKSWQALRRVAKSGGKSVIGNALLACILDSERCLFTVMSDLTRQRFSAITKAAFPDTVKLWDAFYDLVLGSLLPLACLNVVHTDIRCRPQAKLGQVLVYNILGRITDSGDVELRLIDYESLVLYSMGSNFNEQQRDAVSAGNFALYTLARSPCNFLLWQVLWMAYTLYVPVNTGILTEISTDAFMAGLFSEDDSLDNFRAWLNGFDELKEIAKTMKELPQERLVSDEELETRYTREPNDLRRGGETQLGATNTNEHARSAAPHSQSVKLQRVAATLDESQTEEAVTDGPGLIIRSLEILTASFGSNRKSAGRTC